MDLRDQDYPAAMGGEPGPIEFLQLVADPHRWELLRHLGDSDRRVGELAALLGKAQNLVSYHLGELRTAGLVSSRRSSADGRDTYYRLDLGRCGDRFGAAAAALHPAIRLAPAGAPPVVGGRRPRILFLCTGNSARSQIAEALLEARSAGAVEARSAGSAPKPLHPNAVRVLAARGIDIAGRSSKHVDRVARMRFDRVITLCDVVREVCPELPGQPVAAHWSMADPAAAGRPDDETYPAFERTAEELDVRIDLLLAQLADPSRDGRTTHAHR
jgi:ArsR family transcriptional regulator, arsenate/arsenite/antimonite-responsive transcriptional repressor / arsenate reductase (thioredoxin)